MSVAAVERTPTASVAASQVSGYTATVSQADIAERLRDREQRVDRSARRVTLEEKPEAVGHRFTTAPLKLRTEPRENAKVITVVEAAAKVFITGVTRNGYAEVVHNGLPFWVNAQYLAKKKPEPEKPDPTPSTSPAAEPSGGTCTASPPSGVVSGATAVFEAVCSNFPSISTYGGYRNDGEHSDGKAIDVMVSGDLGWQVAEYLRAHASELNLYDVIYSQHIWTPERASEGWRPMEDRGSTTANHYDHVHVAVN